MDLSAAPNPLRLKDQGSQRKEHMADLLGGAVGKLFDLDEFIRRTFRVFSRAYAGQC